ncbi:AraC family transcriptional regulator [Dyella terrae]|uniref:AraC family transcriptional regulator n=1 Tax=Dyella terrae TaxID=522259 RepID=UPI001EFC4F34|nr:AraC family transcriptional regulator [Dyella terrae]ULU23899.1 AraC family transcriptional regulator [Dyella terrae]
MTDPLSEIVTLLQPEAAFSKISSAAGPWQVRRVEAGRPFYGVILEGACRLAIEGREPLILEAGDFLLIPASSGFAMSSKSPPARDVDSVPTMLPGGEYRLGHPDGPPDVRMLVGYCTFGSPDAALLVSLLPKLVHVRGQQRLSTLVQLVIEESRTQRPARKVILSRLLEVLLIEALRSTTGTTASPGLLNGLADARLAAAIRCMHESPTRAWTVAQLAKEAALSRSAFFERFSRAVGMPPMEYLLAWRMALAKRLLQRDGVGIADVAERIGYSSASTFSVAFTRHVGLPPARYAREHTAARE